jgi:hypothetical protein
VEGAPGGGRLSAPSSLAHVRALRARKSRMRAIYNSFMSKRGWHDDETDGFIPEMIKKHGLRHDGSVLTDFDLIEMDEGRWYPDMWRDAWR